MSDSGLEMAERAFNTLEHVVDLISKDLYSIWSDHYNKEEGECFRVASGEIDDVYDSIIKARNRMFRARERE